MNTLVLEPGRAVQAPTKTALSALRKILRKTELNSKALMRETGLTPSQLIFMQLLDDGLEHTAGSVAARMGITQATTTALIQKLEALNMVARRKGQTDRRQVWLSLTDKGRKVLEIAPRQPCWHPIPCWPHAPSPAPELERHEIVERVVGVRGGGGRFRRPEKGVMNGAFGLHCIEPAQPGDESGQLGGVL